MGLGKSLGLGFLIYVALNFVMQLLLAVAAGAIDLYFDGITSAPLLFISTSIAGGTISDPGSSILTAISMGVMLFGMDEIFMGIIMIIVPIVPPLVAAIVVGKTSESPGKAVLSWFLVMIISAAVPLVISIIDPASTAAGLAAVLALFSGDILLTIIYVLILVLFNTMFWGVVSALLGKED